MDRIQEIDKKPWISRRLIHLEKLVALREPQLLPIISGPRTSVLSDDEEKQLSHQLDRFMAQGQKEVQSCFLFNSTDERTLIKDSDCKLKTYRLQLEHAKRMISDRTYKVSYLMKLRTTRREILMRHLALTNRSHNLTTEPASTTVCEPGLTAIVVVQLWAQPSKTKIKLQKEILFRADQSLTELRSQFKCPRDYGVPMDLSENPEEAERIFNGELFKSGFFLIGDTFYNDLRDQNNVDLSCDIIDWASKKVLSVDESGKNALLARGIGPFQSKRMEDNTFLDLRFRLGCPYLYLHQGDCEHLFSISDIRYMANDSITLNKTKFPFTTATYLANKNCNSRCYLCKNRPPHWYTRNNDRLPFDPFFFCEVCFYSFNYDKDKKKIGQFQAYLYTSECGIPDNVAMIG